MKIQDIIDGIAVKIFNEFGSDYKIYTEQVEHGLRKPCFTVALATDNSSCESWIKDRHSKGFTVCYYPSGNNPLAECEAVLERLYSALAMITAAGIAIGAVGNIVGSIDYDNVLIVSVNYDYVDYRPQAMVKTPVDDVILSLESALNGVIAGVNIIDKDVQEGFARPCLYLELQSIQSDLSGDMPHDVCNFRLTYYANYNIADWQQLLADRDLLNQVLIYPIEYKGPSGGYLSIASVNWTFDRDNLLCSASFAIELYGNPRNADEDYEYMSALYEDIEG